MTAVIEQSGPVFPVPGDTGRILPGITAEFRGTCEIDLIRNGVAEFTASGENVLITGVEGFTFRVNTVVY